MSNDTFEEPNLLTIKDSAVNYNNAAPVKEENAQSQPEIDLFHIEPPVNQTKEPAESVLPADNKYEEFDFASPPASLPFAKPIALLTPKQVFEVNSWKKVLIACFNYALAQKSVEELLSFSNGILSSNPTSLRVPHKLSERVFLETNFSATDVIKTVGKLIRFCNFPADQFIIRYIPKKAQNAAPKKMDYTAILSDINETSTAQFIKKLDYSIFTAGLTIPVMCHETFLSNLSVNLEPGQSHKVTLIIDKYHFEVTINNVRFTDSNCKRHLSFRWTPKSPIAQSFQESFPNEFRQLEKDRNYRYHIDTELMVSCGDLPDEFKIELRNGLKDIAKQEENIIYSEPSFTKSSIDITPFITKLLNDFPNGFEFNNSSIKLLEAAAKKSCSEAERRALKRLMFKRSDGIYLLPEMVADSETCAKLKKRIEEYFSQFFAFSLPVLYEEFAERLRGLINPGSDFKLFLQYKILPELPEGGDILGTQQKQICIPHSYSQQEVLDFIAEIFRGKMQENGDAVLVDDLLSDLPSLNLAAADDIIRNSIPEAVEIEIDGLQYWKLLDSFCLPEDFMANINQIITEIEQQGKSPSLQIINTELGNQYGSDFREIYALASDEVFQQVITKSIKGDGYIWKNKLLIKQGKKQATNVADEFLQTCHGIFEESEFFEYAAQHRGLTNKGMLICTFLRNKCIRFDKVHWVSLATFEKQSDFSEEAATKIVMLIKNRLFHQLFLPLGNLPSAFYSELPPIHFQNHIFNWNEYLLASIAEHKLKDLQVVNTDPSPYTVTAIVLPDINDYDGKDVIGFVFRTLQRASMQFDSADQVFEYLKEHKIRMAKTQKLMDRINSYWKFV